MSAPTRIRPGWESCSRNEGRSCLAPRMRRRKKTKKTAAVAQAFLITVNDFESTDWSWTGVKGTHRVGRMRMCRIKRALPQRSFGP